MAVTLEKIGPRYYLRGLPFSAKDEARDTLGLSGNNFDREEKCWWVGAAKREAAEQFAAKINAAAASIPAGDGKPKPEDDSRRVYAKVKHAGRTYYVVAESHANNSCRVCLLYGVGKWVNMAACELVKVYQPREERGMYGRPTGRTVYTTLGSIREFVEKQQRAEAAGLPQCPVCGIRGGEFVHDLETGMECHRRCADMPADE